MKHLKVFFILLFLLATHLSSFSQRAILPFNLPQKREAKIDVPATTPILISVIQPYWPFEGDLIVNSPYTAIRIGEYYWMSQNLNDSIPARYAEPWNSGTPWTGIAAMYGVTQETLNRDMDRLFLDKSQFQIDIEDFHKYYGRYYTRTDVQYFSRGDNLKVYEGTDKVRTAWKVPKNDDFRQLFAMCPVPNGGLGQIAVRTTLSYKRKENPLAYDIHDPEGGMAYRTYWFEYSSNLLGFNMMPGGSRLNGAGWISNGLGPNNGAWWGEAGDIYHLFHTSKYATDGAQVTIHDWLSTPDNYLSWHWYNVRFCRELTDEELGYKLYINVENYKEGYAQTIKELDVNVVDIIKLGLDDIPPAGYYELPKGYLRGFYVQYVLGKKRPEKYIKQIAEHLKQVDDDIFYDANNQRVIYERETVASTSGLSLKIYPSPMESVLHVDVEDLDEEIISIYLYNLYGLEYQKKENFDNYNDIDVSKLPTGLHFLIVETTKGKQSFKLMKK